MPQGRTPFEQIALLLQGGGALGAYQAGVYEALAEADLHPDWVAGISIGAINSAIIAGNPPKRRVDALRDFWQAVSTSPLGIPFFQNIKYDEIQHQVVNQARALGVLLFGAPNLFVPRLPPPTVWPPGSPDVRARAFAMPLTSPAYPVGPYRFVNREFLIITYRTDPQKLRELVPEPLQTALRTRELVPKVRTVDCGYSEQNNSLS